MKVSNPNRTVGISLLRPILLRRLEELQEIAPCKCLPIAALSGAIMICITTSRDKRALSGCLKYLVPQLKKETRTLGKSAELILKPFTALAGNPNALKLKDVHRYIHALES